MYVEEWKTVAVRVLPYSYLPVMLYEMADFDFPYRGTRRLSKDVTWEAGFDMAWGKSANANTDSVEKSFDLVRDDFQLEVGQKVGMAIVTTEMLITPETTKSFPGSADLKSVYGTEGGLKVFTGSITSVGEDYIEYDVNTSLGFSGSIVFLLDTNQPQSVKPSDYGAAMKSWLVHVLQFRISPAIGRSVRVQVIYGVPPSNGRALQSIGFSTNSDRSVANPGNSRRVDRRTIRGAPEKGLTLVGFHRFANGNGIHRIGGIYFEP